MADNSRIVLPDELEQMKGKVAAGNGTKQTHSLGDLSDGNHLQNRNMIIVPPNCQPGESLDADGVCRDI